MSGRRLPVGLGPAVSSAAWAARGRRAVGIVGAGAVVGGAVAASVAQRAGPTADLVSSLGVKGQRLAKVFRVGEGVAAAASIALGGSVAAAARRPLPTTPGWPPLASPAPPRRARGAALAAAGCLLAVAAVPAPLAARSRRPTGLASPAGTGYTSPPPSACSTCGPWPPTPDPHTAVRQPRPADPLTVTPHHPATAMLQRTMEAAAALLTWQPTPPATSPNRPRPAPTP